MRKTLLNTVLSGALIFTLSGSVFAGGIPVIDASNLAEAIKDAIQQNSIYLEEVKQYAKLVEQYNHAVQNARAHGDMAKLLDLFEVGDTIIYSPAGKSIFSELYGIDPNSPLYEQQARDVLENKFNLPKSNTLKRAELVKYLSAGDADKMVAGWAGTERDSTEAIKNTGLLSTEDEMTKDLNEIRRDTLAVMPSGPDNLNASVQHGLLQTEIEMAQRDQQVRLEKMQVELKLREEIRRLENERLSQESFERNLKKTSEKLAEPFSNQRLPSSAQ
ncbi:hypothetical protein O4H49_20055 [Kiloniella laminariae]|uniref:Uncharacterized protein n=1 Tax=Kiloniella laminariae TaxID=454162 RepID=A0ABT4LPN3_9PROT|nr:type IV secretion system protein [Kiloniella laminariae]MCZ4283089.1 hypothetical protein [Kiloniella laminariae]